MFENKIKPIIEPNIKTPIIIKRRLTFGSFIVSKSKKSALDNTE